MSPIQPFLDARGVMMLDGGLATELEALGHDLDHPLWSARLLLDAPEDVKRVHTAYLQAGADCISSVSYQATIPGFIREGFSEERAVELLVSSVDLACEARDAFAEEDTPCRPLVAASVGPYGAFLADGSEYRGEYGISASALSDFHEARWNTLVSTRADLLGCETIPSFQECEVLVNLLSKTPSALAWISFSCKDGDCISDGTPLSECAAFLEECHQVVAIGINCTAPRYISSLIGEAKKGAPDLDVAVYPNTGEIYDAKTRKWGGISDPVNFAEASLEWKRLGATILGGCCRTGPDHIRRMRQVLLDSVN